MIILNLKMQIAKKEVDTFQLDKRIPACQLQVVGLKPHGDQLTDLFHSLKLMGTKCLHDYVTLFRSPLPGIRVRL